MSHPERVKLHVVGLVSGFAAQFLLGMTLNLFVTIPASHPGGNAKNYFAGAWHGLVWTLSGAGGIALAIHVYLGIGLCLGCMSLIFHGLRLRDRVWMWVGLLASLFTLGALFNGLSFINYNHDISSMIMATCWLVAVGVLIFGLLSHKGPVATKA